MKPPAPICRLPGYHASPATAWADPPPTGPWDGSSCCCFVLIFFCGCGLGRVRRGDLWLWGGGRWKWPLSLLWLLPGRAAGGHSWKGELAGHGPGSPTCAFPRGGRAWHSRRWADGRGLWKDPGTPCARLLLGVCQCQATRGERRSLCPALHCPTSLPAWLVLPGPASCSSWLLCLLGPQVRPRAPRGHGADF